MTMTTEVEFRAWFCKKYQDWRVTQAAKSLYGSVSCRAFSRWLGINQALVVQWLNGKALPGHRTVHTLAIKLGPEVYDLLGENGGLDLQALALLKVFYALSEEQQGILLDIVNRMVEEGQ